MERSDFFLFDQSVNPAAFYSIVRSLAPAQWNGLLLSPHLGQESLRVTEYRIPCAQEVVTNDNYKIKREG